MNRPSIIVLVGCPGSGKSTYAKNNASKNDVILSSDSIRAELYGDEAIQGNPAEVFTLMQKRAVEALKDGHTVWYDATSMTRKDRAGIISVCPKFVHIECHIIWAPIETCIKRDAARDRTVGKEVIDRMLKKFQMPYYDEGIDEIKIIHPSDFDCVEYSFYIMDAMKIPHDNPHHTLSVYDHCVSACDYSNDHHCNINIETAALIHDCGKPYVKSFTNSNGEVTETAHFYQHQCVGSYMACGMITNIDSIWLVSTHMDSFLNTKYYNNLPPYLKTMVDQLHEADLAAH